MRPNTSFRIVPACLAAIVLVAAGASMSLRAAPPALNGQVTLRPLTPQDKKDYALTNAQGASGLATVGVGQPAYLEALVNAAIAPANIVSVTWVLTNQPIGSVATLADSPLGANVPTYKMADRYNNSGAPVSQVAGRTLLRPDITGQYKVVATITTTDSGTTNLTQTITAGKYLGIQACALCHSGGVIAPDKYHTWSETPHATFFTRQIDGGTDPATSHYGKNCISCHTVGYDANTNAVNDGFDDIAKQLGWTFPTNLVAGNWASMPQELKNLSNIQCENCHGPGSEHAYALGNTNLSNWPRIDVTFIAGDCAQCHDSKPNHSRSAEWNNSKHAVATRTPSGPTRAACARCHTGGGFAGYADTLGTTNTYTTNNANTVYTAITCATCHNPHDAGKPHQLRAGPSITLGDGTTVTNAGDGGFCMNCHQSRNGSVTNSIVKYPLLQETWAGGSAFGPHDNPAGDMLEGANGWTYGQDIPSSAHRFAVTNTCVGCHMQTVASTDPGFTKVGGHTFKMSYDAVTGGVTNTVEMVNVCIKCHGQTASFDMKKTDYNGDGVIDGVQTEVQKLLDRLATLMPNSIYRADGNYVGDGLVKSPSVKTNWQAKFLKGAYNFQFVNNDLSKGVHNAAYAVGLLKASIADLTGDANQDGLPDWWQTHYFGSTTSANSAPNATPAGDGVPNWMKYGLGLNPMTPGVVLPDGVVWANAGPVGNPGATNTIQIYTAAEVVFNTEVGKTYQLEAISSLGQGWRPVGAPTAGTGGAMSLVTPTRSNLQQYYRVVSTP